MYLAKVTDREYIEKLQSKINNLKDENSTLKIKVDELVDRIQELETIKLEAVIKAAIEYHESRTLTSEWHDIQVHEFRNALGGNR